MRAFEEIGAPQASPQKQIDYLTAVVYAKSEEIQDLELKIETLRLEHVLALKHKNEELRKYCITLETLRREQGSLTRKHPSPPAWPFVVVFGFFFLGFLILLWKGYR